MVAKYEFKLEACTTHIVLNVSYLCLETCVYAWSNV
jgi:hypothetical protein